MIVDIKERQLRKNAVKKEKLRCLPRLLGALPDLSAIFPKWNIFANAYWECSRKKKAQQNLIRSNQLKKIQTSNGTQIKAQNSCGRCRKPMSSFVNQVKEFSEAHKIGERKLNQHVVSAHSVPSSGNESSG